MSIYARSPYDVTIVVRTPILFFRPCFYKNPFFGLFKKKYLKKYLSDCGIITYHSNCLFTADLCGRNSDYVICTLIDKIKKNAFNRSYLIS